MRERDRDKQTDRQIQMKDMQMERHGADEEI